MARDSLIKRTSGNRFVRIDKDFLTICEENHCAAALLAYYEYKVNAKYAELEEKKLKNRNYKATEEDFFLQFSPKYLSSALLKLFGRTKIIESNTFLFQKGFITIHIQKGENKEYETSRIAVNIEKINSEIDMIPYSETNNPLFGNEQPLIRKRTTPYSETDRNNNLKEIIEESMYGESDSFAATATTHTPSDVEVSTPDNEPILTDENESKSTEVNQPAGEETFFPRSQPFLSLAEKGGVAASQSLSTLQSDEQRFERFKKLVRNYFKDHACEDEPKVFKGIWALTPKQYVKLIEDYNVNVFQERMEVIKKIILEIQNWKGSKSSANLTIRNWVNRDLRVSSHTMLPATKAEPKLPPPPAAATTLPQEIQFETFEEQTARKRREREEKLNQSNKQNNG